MTLIPFDRLPDHARLWTFAGSRALTDPESSALLQATDGFLAEWTAHRVALATGREWRHDQFLFVAVDEASAGASGCSIDALVRFFRDAERRLAVRLTDNSAVWFRGAGGGVTCVTRTDFQRLADAGTVGLDTVVFDHTIQTVEALRAGRWEVPARQSWHARAFFPTAAPARA